MRRAHDCGKGVRQQKSPPHLDARRKGEGSHKKAQKAQEKGEPMDSHKKAQKAQEGGGRIGSRKKAQGTQRGRGNGSEAAQRARGEKGRPPPETGVARTRTCRGDGGGRAPAPWLPSLGALGALGVRASLFSDGINKRRRLRRFDAWSPSGILLLQSATSSRQPVQDRPRMVPQPGRPGGKRNRRSPTPHPRSTILFRSSR